MTVHRNKFL